MKIPESVQQITTLQPYFENANHLDVKTYESSISLREFMAGFASYYPAWVQLLYRVRALFVRFLGMKQEGIPARLVIKPETIPMTPGRWLSFFRVAAAQEDQFWLGEASDKHLSAYLLVATEPINAEQRRIYEISLEKYRNWAGPVYFNVIRPFHHLVVDQMSRAALRYQPA